MPRVQELLRREVIDLSCGEKMGYASDVELDTDSGRIAALILPEKGRGMNLFGKPNEIRIPWRDIRRISDDLIMVESSDLSTVRQEP